MYKRQVLIFAGTGNNGGDGFVAARHLAACGVEVTLFLVGDPARIRTHEASTNWEIVRRMRDSIKVHQVKIPEELEGVRRAIREGGVIVDAMLGTGLKGPIREPYASVVRLINESGVPVVAVDSPTGLDPTSGEVCGEAVKSTYTLTFHRAKRGFLKAKEYTGEVIVESIGIPPEVERSAIGERIPPPCVSHRRVPKLVSACLLGANCRYDGTSNSNEGVIRLAGAEALIPVCPEQLGGMGTPREPMEIVGGEGSDVLDGRARVLNRKGEDVTENMLRGADETLKIAKIFGVREAIFKSGSPSCGCGSGREKREGVTTALLRRNGIRVLSEECLRAESARTPCDPK